MNYKQFLYQEYLQLLKNNEILLMVQIHNTKLPSHSIKPSFRFKQIKNSVFKVVLQDAGYGKVNNLVKNNMGVILCDSINLFKVLSYLRRNKYLVLMGIMNPKGIYTYQELQNWKFTKSNGLLPLSQFGMQSLINNKK